MGTADDPPSPFLGSDPDPPEFESSKSVCPFCGVGCGIEHANGDKATGWKGSVNQRGEVCPKGVAAFEPVRHEKRLVRPLVRESGTHVVAPWEEALERIEAGVREVVDEHGPESVAFFASSSCTNEENYLVQKIARALGTNNVDNCARLCHSSTVAAMVERFGAGAMTNTLEDVGEADAFLVCGANPAEQHPIAFQSYLSPAVDDGTTLIHVDPRENATTAEADVHLPVTPGYDIPLLNAMAKVVVEEELVDEAFLDERAEGRAAFEAHLEDVDVEANAREAGVDPDDLRAAARAYGEADRAAAFTGMGMSQHHCGTDNVHALINLAVLTGNVGKPGTGINPLRGQNNVQGANDVGARPGDLPGYDPVTDADARDRCAEVWGFEPPAEPGRTQVEWARSVGDDGVRAAVVFGENPAVTEPNANEVADALADLDFLAVIDLFETETAELADVVLPGSSWAEKAGTVTNTDRRVQRMRPSADPPGEARRDLEILQEVGRRLTGPDLAFDYDGPADVFAELTEVTPIYGGMSYGEIGEGYQRWPFPAGAESGTDVLHEGEFASGDRRTELAPVDHVPPADDLADDQLVLTTGRVLQHFNSGALTRRSGTLMRLRGEDVVQLHPDDADARGIEDGDEVRLSNERGAVTVAAEVTPSITRGTVFTTFHYAEPLINVLTGDALDPVAKIPEYKHSAVTVERV
ncbi:formate dehydrogenase subunit alpha [Halobiforma lacisalsi AJ5]|uniref:Formate dehydrogenase alpha subunit n=1 Tax=Natronobacterium lacisalsi AJ5 TaxID=358396 RepID=M0L1G7_NATLA|nr:formate dehydrogenase subunit alpha [Halobiforma lacisalsi]APW96335.1 formate dehydrogenase subunit alpha [Halobiforma lacisalsi AJ5]EMA27391.1 formate dehydrogenase alpha subunit [Halobiforma lacisalsi AJ5]